MVNGNITLGLVGKEVLYTTELHPRNSSHQPFPFVQISAKAQLAGGIETQPCVDLTALAAFGVVGLPIVAAGNENVRGERVVVRFSLM